MIAEQCYIVQYINSQPTNQFVSWLAICILLWKNNNTQVSQYIDRLQNRPFSTKKRFHRHLAEHLLEHFLRPVYQNFTDKLCFGTQKPFSGWLQLL